MGAYLRSITVRVPRDWSRVTLPFRPGPGLIVVAGRNGSGKSTLAEGLELALTGTNSRWNDKAAVWSQNWRNLHAGDPAHIRVDIAEEGSGATTIGVDWPAGEAVDVDDFKAWVQRDGKKREDTSVLGWAGALEMYRPLLSYDELGGILEGRPSDFYDQLHKLLGLEQLTEAMTRLDAEIKQLPFIVGRRTHENKLVAWVVVHRPAHAQVYVRHSVGHVRNLPPDTTRRPRQPPPAAGEGRRFRRVETPSSYGAPRERLDRGTGVAEKSNASGLPFRSIAVASATRWMRGDARPAVQQAAPMPGLRRRRTQRRAGRPRSPRPYRCRIQPLPRRPALGRGGWRGNSSVGIVDGNGCRSDR